jgi:hypothetical protein
MLMCHINTNHIVTHATYNNNKLLNNMVSADVTH